MFLAQMAFCGSVGLLAQRSKAFANIKRASRSFAKTGLFLELFSFFFAASFLEGSGEAFFEFLGRFGEPFGGHVGVVFEKSSGFFAKGGHVDFVRQYSVFALFSRFQAPRERSNLKQKAFQN